MCQRELNHSDCILTEGRTLDHAAAVYDVIAPMMTFWQEGRMSRKAVDLLGLRGDERVLDIGCGTGTLTIGIAKDFLTTEGSCAVGLDAAPKMIARATKKSGDVARVSFDVCAAERLPYDDGSFDAAVSTFFFHHIHFDLKQKALAEMWRVLKDGAKAVIVDVDRPSNLWGKVCAWSGYILFQQEEIKENIQGRLTEAIEKSPFREWKLTARYQGYISVFELIK